MTAEEFTAEEVQEIMTRARLSLTPWLDNSEREDLVGEAYLAVWKRLVRLEARPPRALLMTLVTRTAKWAAVDYLGSTRCGRLTGRNYWKRGGEPIPVLSYYDSAVLAEPPWWDGGIEGTELRLAAGQIWEWVVEHATDRQREAVQYHFREGLTQGEVAKRMGCLESAVYCHVQRALNHYRAAHGIGMRVLDKRRGRSSHPWGALAARRSRPTGPIAGCPKQGQG